MNIKKTLTKENFFNEMMEKFPLSMAKFCKWIDEYKEAVGWNGLFGAHVTMNAGRTVCSGVAPKFHDIPYAMQYGIWIEYCRQTLSNYFEQPEHISDFVDLEEDIKVCFAELEPLIADEND